MLKLDVSALAEDDAAEALAYYATISPALRQDFRDKLAAALALLCDLPEIGSRRFSHLFPGVDLLGKLGYSRCAAAGAGVPNTKKPATP